MTDEAERQDAFRRAGFIITADFGIREETEIIDDMANAITRLRAENARLREALDYYADWHGDGKEYLIIKRGDPMRASEAIETVHGIGQRARAALKETGDEAVE